MNKAPGMPGTTTGFDPGQDRGHRERPGHRRARRRGPSEVDGVDHSDVPEEYREQVRQYFQP